MSAKLVRCCSARPASAAVHHCRCFGAASVNCTDSYTGAAAAGAGLHTLLPAACSSPLDRPFRRYVCWPPQVAPLRQNAPPAAHADGRPPRRVPPPAPLAVLHAAPAWFTLRPDRGRSSACTASAGVWQRAEARAEAMPWRTFLLDLGHRASRPMHNPLPLCSPGPMHTHPPVLGIPKCRDASVHSLRKGGTRTPS